jgi:Fuc2NAc and GlcNAc transferase
VSPSVLIAGGATLCLSFLLTLLITRKARVIGLIDVPNERSSHAVPTPRGGGLAVVIASLVALTILVVAGLVPLRLFLALAPGGAAVAAVGFIDDRRPLSARIRLFVHFMAAGWAVLCIGPINLFDFERGRPLLQGLVYGLATIGIVWFLNMYNFMDGIDGIAGSQAVFMSLGAALLGLFSFGIAYTAATAVVIGTAALGFLLWNWPPAKIFLGDVGSGYLGFVFAVIGLASGIHDPTAPWTLLILAGVFAVDATFTVVRRFLRGERVTQPHRTHGFQLLARKMGHQRVTLSISLVNLAWLLPCAIASALWPQYAAWIVPLAFAPLALAAFAIGAGRPEVEAQAPRAVVIPFVAAQANLKRRPAAPAHEHHGIRAAQQYSPAPAAIERSANESG